MVTAIPPSHRRPEAATHHFAVGQAVRLRTGFAGPFRFAGIFHVTANLPPAGDSLQYRIRNADEGYERVTTEEALEAVPPTADKSATLIEGTFGQDQGWTENTLKSGNGSKPFRQGSVFTNTASKP